MDSLEVLANEAILELERAKLGTKQKFKNSFKLLSVLRVKYAQMEEPGGGALRTSIKCLEEFLGGIKDKDTLSSKECGQIEAVQGIFDTLFLKFSQEEITELVQRKLAKSLTTFEACLKGPSEEAEPLSIDTSFLQEGGKKSKDWALVKSDAQKGLLVAVYKGLLVAVYEGIPDPKKLEDLAKFFDTIQDEGGLWGGKAGDHQVQKDLYEMADRARSAHVAKGVLNSIQPDSEKD